MKNIVLVAALIVVSTSGSIEGRTWNVPTDAPTIQAAVDSCAASGDAIAITAGVYHQGSIVVDGKNISIDKSGVGNVTVIAPSIGIGTFMTYRNGAAGALRSLVIRGFGTGVAIENASTAVYYISLKACGTGLTVAGASTPQFMYGIVDSCVTGVEVQAGSVVLQNETIVHCGVGASFSAGSSTMTRTIVCACTTGVQCGGGGAALDCNDFWANGTDYGGCTPGPNDIGEDPKFCLWAAANPYALHVTSPCYDKTLNPCNVQIGAITGIAPGCTAAAVQRTTWGAIKGIYR